MIKTEVVKTNLMQYVLKTSRQTISEETSLQNDNELIIPVSADTIITGQLILYYASPSNADLDVTFDDDSGLHEGYFKVGAGNTNRVAFGTEHTIATTGGVQLGVNFIAFTAKPSVNTVIRFKFAQNVSQVASTFIEEGAMLIYGGG